MLSPQGLEVLDSPTQPCQPSSNTYISSTCITSPLTTAIFNQNTTYTSTIYNDQQRAKQSTHRINRQLINTTAEHLKSKMNSQLARVVTLASEKGASSWLTALPIDEHGFALMHKGAFRDALSLRYLTGMQPTNLRTKCICSKPFSVDHALCCPTGGFPSIRHNQLRDI